MTNKDLVKTNSAQSFLNEMREKLANMSDEEFNERFDAVCDENDSGLTVAEFLETEVN